MTQRKQGHGLHGASGCVDLVADRVAWVGTKGKALALLLAAGLAACSSAGDSTGPNLGGAGSGMDGQAGIPSLVPAVLEPCSAGLTRECECEVGSGSQLCVEDGTGFTACSNCEVRDAGTPDESDAASDAGNPDGGEVVGLDVLTPDPSNASSYLFDQQELRTYNIKLSTTDLAFLDNKPNAEQYVVGELEFEGTTVTQVGVRYKGSVGAFLQPCTSASIGQTPGMKTGKCSIKLSFNHVDPEGQFYGLRKLNFHSMNQDKSLMRDRLAYTMFRQFGIPASRAVHARVLINGVLEGLFIMVEQVDGRFTRSRFGEGGRGNLYKEIWPIHSNASVYTNALETNEKDMPSVQRMLDFRAAIAQGIGEMEKWIDREQMIRYIAADRVMVNDDGIFHWWCAAGGQGNNSSAGRGNHNYYWYEASNADRFWLIPWDMDNSLAGSDFVRVNPEWRTSGSCTCSFLNPAGQIAPRCDTMINRWATEWNADYEAAVDEFLAGPFQESNVDALLSAWEEQITSAVEESAGKGGAPNKTEWLSALADLENAIGSMRVHRGHNY